LAGAVKDLKLRRPIVGLALPRGGVPVAYEVALALRAPLDVLVVRKVGMPGQPELAIGAVAAGGIIVREPGTVGHLPALDTRFERLAQREVRELDRRERSYRSGPPLPVRGKTVLLVDDGLATGSTMRAATVALRRLGAARIVIAAPVGARETCESLGDCAEEVVCAHSPSPFVGVGEWYDDFAQTGDEEVRALLSTARVEAHG